MSNTTSRETAARILIPPGRRPVPPRWRLGIPGLAMLVLLCSLPAARAQETHDNVVIVLDASGSMRTVFEGTDQDRMSAAKSALKEVLKKVPSSTRIGLLVFSAANFKKDWAYPLGPRDDAALMRAIDLPQPGSGTPLGAYLKKGADRLLEERARHFGYGTYRLLVVTDGEAQDQNLVDRFTPEVIARGITVDVIGVAMRQGHTLATRVHSYRSATDPAALRRALAEAFAEVAAKPGDENRTDDFALIAPIPPATANAMIRALANSGNQPIGERPGAATPKRAEPTTNSSAPATAPPPAAPPPARKRLFPFL